MKRPIVVAAAGLVLVAAGCAGCSSNNSDKGSPSPGPAAPAGPRVIVDGQNQNVSGPVTCTPNGENINIGVGDVANGIGAVVSTGSPPIVHAVGLGAVNGVTLGYSDAAPGQAGNAGAAVSGKYYQIKGTATGSDISNPAQPKTLTKPFELDVTCP